MRSSSCALSSASFSLLMPPLLVVWSKRHYTFIHEDTRRGTKAGGPSCPFVCLRGRISAFDAVAEEVRHLDEEGPAVSVEPRLERPGESAEAVVAQVVVV